MAAAALLSAALLPATAQEFRSSYFMQTSNFRHQMNPALLDSSYVAVLAGNINVGATGNIGLKNFVYKLTPEQQTRFGGYEYTTFMNPTVDAAKFLGDLHDKNRLDLYLNYNLFSVAFKAFGGTNLVEFNLRSNTNVSLPKELFEFAKTAGAKEHYSLSDIGMRTQNYAELALGHSHKIGERLTVGAKMKFLLAWPMPTSRPTGSTSPSTATSGACRATPASRRPCSTRASSTRRPTRTPPTAGPA